jgi:hypothetical protein
MSCRQGGGDGGYNPTRPIWGECMRSPRVKTTSKNGRTTRVLFEDVYSGFIRLLCGKHRLLPIRKYSQVSESGHRIPGVLPTA